MSEQDQVSTQQPQEQLSNKELNFRKQEQMYQRLLAEKEERLRALEQQVHQKQQEPEDDDSEPYVDNKKLHRTLNNFSQTTKSDIEKAMEVAKQKAKEELRNEMWMETNPDFYEVMQHAERFAQRAPKLAETILKMPEGFERQKLVYQNIKELGLDRPEQKAPSIQDKIDANRRSPYYQPSGVGSAPYAQVGDFSSSGQKNAYDKMQELKKSLRL